MGLGTPELIIIFVVALIVFGPRKLPELGRSLGKSLSEFKRASNELKNTLDDEIRLEEHRAASAQTAAPSVPPAPPAAADPLPAPPAETTDLDAEAIEADTVPRRAPDLYDSRTS
jgi:TatA/E family protein of Tat protein translocase